MLEPKFNVDGSPFTGPWGRPQHDGPALRALSYLSLSLSPFADLDHVAVHYSMPGFDLWEEVYAQSHFFTALVQYCALQRGALVGDAKRAVLYRQASRILYSEILSSFWDDRRFYILSHVYIRSGPWKESNLDVSVIIASLVVSFTR